MIRGKIKRGIVCILTMMSVVVYTTGFAAADAAADPVIVCEPVEDAVITGEETIETAEDTGKIVEDIGKIVEDIGKIAEDTGKIAEDISEIKEAEDAFGSILENKDIMALVYLTDECRVYDSPYIYNGDGGIEDDAGVITVLSSGHTVYLKGVKLGDPVYGIHAPLYCVSFFKDGEEFTGYLEGRHLAYSDEDWIDWERKYPDLLTGADDSIPADTGWEDISPDCASTYADIAAFPVSYQDKLTKLKNSHPNWMFVALNTGLDFKSSVSKELGDKSWVYINTTNKNKGWVGSNTAQKNWAYATETAVSYHMDPRNFLTEDYIFQFEQLTFNKSYHTEEAVQSFLNGTFMKGTLPDDTCTYANAFFRIGSSRKISPVHLASRVYQEQGKGTSPLISGSYPGYEGYYNYFNVGATGSTEKDVIVNGLTYAKNKGWSTRYASLEGGAATIGNNYILKGQDTLYLEKYNVDPNAKNAVYTHQYMQNIQAPSSEGLSTKKMYSGAGSLNSAFVFKIPVYKNMEESVPEPTPTPAPTPTPTPVPKPVLTPISKAVVTGLEAKTYTGHEEDVRCVPVLSLKDGTPLNGIEKSKYDVLNEDEALKYDFTYLLQNTDKAGTAKVKLCGVNGYKGTLTKSYKINPASIADLYETYCRDTEKAVDENIFCIKYYSSMEALKHGLSVQKNGVGLPEEEVRAAGVPVITVRNLDEIEDVYLRGGSRPQMIVYLGGAQLDKKNFSVSYKNYCNVTALQVKESKLPGITITGKGNLKGTVKNTYVIKDGNLADENKVVITAADKKFANRKNAWKSTVVLKDIDGVRLRAGTDYEKNILYTYADEEPVVTDIRGNCIERYKGDEVGINDVPAAGTRIRVSITGKGVYAGQGDPAVRTVEYHIVAPR